MQGLADDSEDRFLTNLEPDSDLSRFSADFASFEEVAVDASAEDIQRLYRGALIPNTAITCWKGGLKYGRTGRGYQIALLPGRLLFISFRPRARRFPFALLDFSQGAPLSGLS